YEKIPLLASANRRGDYQASSLSGLTLLLQASNLSNSPYRTYAETKDRPLEYIEWGRTIVLGVNYKF
ncbi:hypothetical protein, partial [Xanthomonas citri]|uniref:hypothetical protein n=1 Tax=Xanthomonas citri TaxID=346 RepID=UPI00058EF10C